MSLSSDAEFPEKLKPLFEPHRYKVAYGGRGGAKSWGYARALLILAASKKLRILCAREVQKSIKDSVHSLLSDQIQALGLGGHFEVLQTEIRGINGSQFLFAGLSSLTAESIKSFEGVDICWVEEARSVSKNSWNILIPTIRKDAPFGPFGKGAEIWVSFNPELDDDETYKRFVVNPPPDSVVMRINWEDNPWFPSVLMAEKDHLYKVDPETAKNVWGGECRPTVDGAIYGREVIQAIEDKRVRPVPYDPLLRVHTVWDLGWNDQMSIILAQRLGSEVRIIDFIEDSHKTLSEYVAMLEKKPYRYGTDFLPHDGAAKNFQTGKSAQELLSSMNRKAVIVANVPVEEGIRAARMMFPRVFFDEAKAQVLIGHLKRYRRQIHQTTEEPMAPLHDEHSHAADAFRYLSLCVEQMTNDERGKPIKYDNRGIV